MAILVVPPYASLATVTLTSDEFWCAEGGTVRVQTAAPASAADGIPLSTGGSAIKFSTGAVVRVWLDGPVGASVVRMAV